MSKSNYIHFTDLPVPQSFRRALVFGVGFGFLGIDILSIFNIIEYFTTTSLTTVESIAPFVIGLGGISYISYLCISFLLIGFKKLPGCEFTAISHGLLKKNIHVCVDSVLNSVLDNMQKKQGISFNLLKTESARKWIAGLVFLFIVFFFLLLEIVELNFNIILVAIISLGYFIYDITIHRFSIGRKDLTGNGDYTRLLVKLGKSFQANRLTILRLILIGWGAINIPLGVYTGLGLGNTTELPLLHRDVSNVYEHMLSAIYIPLGICAILAALDPVRHKLLILFIIFSSFTHGGIMTYDAFTTNLTVWEGLTEGSLTLFGTGIILSIFYPSGILKNKKGDK